MALGVARHPGSDLCRREEGQCAGDHQPDEPEQVERQMHSSEIGETRLRGAGDDEDPHDHPSRTRGDRNHIALDRRSEARRDRITADAQQHHDEAEH